MQQNECLYIGEIKINSDLYKLLITSFFYYYSVNQKERNIGGRGVNKKLHFSMTSSAISYEPVVI